MTKSTVILQPSVPNFVGEVMLGVRGMSSSPPQMLLDVVPPNESKSSYELSLGDTFPIGAQTWRFEDIAFSGADRWRATIRVVEPGSPPFTPPPLSGNRVWNEVKLIPFGRLEEAQLVEVERALSRKLPPIYREWLAENNGATPVENVWIPGRYFSLNRFHPLFGVHPDAPHRDLRGGEKDRSRWLTEDYIVIAVPIGGLLAVRRAHYWDKIYWLPDMDKRYGNAYKRLGYSSPQEYLSAERLMYIAPDIYSFCADLQPAPPVRQGTLADPNQSPDTDDAQG